MSEHFDALETRDPEQRESALMKARAAQVAHARAHAPAGAARLAEWASSPVDSRAALARLPVLRKHELHDRQRAGLASDAFGGFSATKCTRGMLLLVRKGGGMATGVRPISSCERFGLKYGWPAGGWGKPSRAIFRRCQSSRQGLSAGGAA